MFLYVKSWEECHEVLCEIVGAKAGTKAFTASRAGGTKTSKRQQQDTYDQPTGGAKGKGKAKSKNREKNESNPNRTPQAEKH